MDFPIRVSGNGFAGRTGLPVTKVVLYGSYARGTAREDSDIDVAVVVPRLKGDYLKQSAQLFKLTREIDFRIEPVLLAENRDLSGFLEEVMRTGEIVYSSE